MRRTTLTICVVLLLSVGGCLGTQSADSTTRQPEPTTQPAPSTTQSTTATTQSTDTQATSTSPADSVVYHITGSAAPDELKAATATVRIVLAERGTDLGPCWADVYRGPYQPTITPIATPAGTCHRSDAVAIDLTDTNRTVSTPVPDDSSGHAFVVTDIRVTLPNGTVTAAIRDTGGQEVHVVDGQPNDSYRVTLRLEPAPDGAPYAYALVSTVDPDAG
ncbi:MAG: hypothetical protein ABEI98_01805 [Halorhabdus sp.]